MAGRTISSRSICDKRPNSVGSRIAKLQEFSVQKKGERTRTVGYHAGSRGRYLHWPDKFPSVEHAAAECEQLAIAFRKALANARIVYRQWASHASISNIVSLAVPH